jgi:hypothetical protein
VKRGDLSNSGRNIEEILFMSGRARPAGQRTAARMRTGGGEAAHRRRRGCTPAAARLRTGVGEAAHRRRREDAASN